MWFACVHYCATETVLPGYVPVCLCTHLCVFVCARGWVCADASLSPVEEALCVSVEVEGESRARLYKSEQITEAERPATPFHCPASSALCQQHTHAQPNSLTNFILVSDTIVLRISDLYHQVLLNTFISCELMSNFGNSVCKSPCFRIRSGNFQSTI